MLSITMLVLLGNWQIQRFKEKKIFIQSIENNITNPAIPIHKVTNTMSLYSKIKISGHFIPSKNILLYGRRSAYPEHDGYYIISAFLAENGEIYAVSRGWIPHSMKHHQINDLLPSQTPTIIETIILPGENKPFLVPNNDIKNNLWFTLDLNMLSNTIGTTISNFYLMQINAKNLPKQVKPLKTTYLNQIRNNHIEYAIIWYSLSVCSAIIFFLYYPTICKKTYYITPNNNVVIDKN
jgi:surfeit locus 1 family protein